MIPARPTADIVTTANAPCDTTRTPGWLLTTLTGAHLRATSTLIQRLIDTGGADLRGIVVDDHGQAIDVGYPKTDELVITRPWAEAPPAIEHVQPEPPTWHVQWPNLVAAVIVLGLIALATWAVRRRATHATPVS